MYDTQRLCELVGYSLYNAQHGLLQITQVFGANWLISTALGYTSCRRLQLNAEAPVSPMRISTSHHRQHIQSGVQWRQNAADRRSGKYF